MDTQKYKFPLKDKYFIQSSLLEIIRCEAVKREKEQSKETLLGIVLISGMVLAVSVFDFHYFQVIALFITFVAFISGLIFYFKKDSPHPFEYKHVYTVSEEMEERGYSPIISNYIANSFDVNPEGKSKVAILQNGKLETINLEPFDDNSYE